MFKVYDVDATSDSQTIVSDTTSIVNLEYMIVKSEPNDGAFTIDANTGAVTVTSGLELTQNRR